MKAVMSGKISKTIISVVLLISCFSFSQELKYEEVINVDSTITKKELFNRARTWTSQNFNSPNNSVTTEDVNVGEISGVGSYDYRATKKYMGYSCVEGKVSYRFSFFFKDGRYKYIFSNIEHTGSGGPGCRRVDYGSLTLSEKAPLKGRMIADDYAWHDVKQKTLEKITSLVDQLKAAMNKKHETSNDW